MRIPIEQVDEDRAPRRRPARRRPLNVSGIKTVIVFAVGWITALVSGITGLGAQSAYAPMLTWMLGFAPDKAQGTALNFAAWTALAAVLGAYAAGAMPAHFIVSGLVLVIGAIVGALLAAPVVRKLQGQGWRRTFQSIGIALMMAVIVQVSHTSSLLAGKPNIAEWQSPGLLLLLGVGVGAATQVLGVAGGTLLVPALYFFSGLRSVSSGASVLGNHAAPAVGLSLFVIALASTLPAMAYNRKGLVDDSLRTPIIVAGLLGGFCGGWILPSITARVVMVVSAFIAMFLCARELARMSLESNTADSSSPQV